MEPVIVLLFVLLVCQGYINGEESIKDSSHKIRRQINPYWQNYNPNYEASTRSTYDEKRQTNHEDNVNINHFLRPVNLQDFMTKMVPLYEQTKNTFRVEHDDNNGPERFTQPLRQYFRDKMKRKRIAEKYLIENYMTPKPEIEYDQYQQTLPNPLAEIKGDTSIGEVDSYDNNVAFTEYDDSVTQYGDQITTIKTDLENSAWSWLRPEPSQNKENNQFYSSLYSTPTLYETNYNQNQNYLQTTTEYSIENIFSQEQNKYTNPETYEDISMDTRIFEEDDDSGNKQEYSDYEADNVKDVIHFKDRPPFLEHSSTEADSSNPDFFDNIVTLHDIEISSYPTEELNVHIIKGFSLSSRDDGDFPYSNYTVEDILGISDKSLIPSVTQRVDKIQITQLPDIINGKESKDNFKAYDLFGEASENKYAFKNLNTTDGYTITDEDKVNIQNLPHGKITKESNEELNIDVIKGFVLSSSNDGANVSKKDVPSTINSQFYRKIIKNIKKYPVDNIEEVETKDHQVIEPSPTKFNTENMEGIGPTNYETNISMSKYEIKPSEKSIINYSENSRSTEIKKINNQKETTVIDEIDDEHMITISSVNIERIFDNMNEKNSVKKTETIEAKFQNDHTDSYIVFENKTEHVPDLTEYNGNVADQVANEKALPFVEDSYTMSINHTSEYNNNVTEDYQSVYSGNTDILESFTGHVPVVNETQLYHKHLTDEVSNRTSISGVTDNNEMKTLTLVEYDEKSFNKDSPSLPVMVDILKKNIKNNHEDITDNILNKQPIPYDDGDEFIINSTTVVSDAIEIEKILSIVEKKYETNDNSKNEYDEDMADENLSVFTEKVIFFGATTEEIYDDIITDEISNEKSLPIVNVSYERPSIPIIEDNENTDNKSHLDKKIDFLKRGENNTNSSNESELFPNNFINNKSIENSLTAEISTTVEYFEMAKGLPYVTEYFEMQTIPSVEYVAEENRSVYSGLEDVFERTTQQISAESESKSYLENITVEVSNEKLLPYIQEKYETTTTENYEMTIERALPTVEESYEIVTYLSVEYDESIVDENHSMFSAKNDALEDITLTVTEFKSNYENTSNIISNEKSLPVMKAKYETVTSPSLTYNENIPAEKSSVYTGKADFLQRLVKLPLAVAKSEPHIENITDTNMTKKTSLTVNESDVDNISDKNLSIRLKAIKEQADIVIQSQSYDKNITDEMTIANTLPIAKEVYETSTFIENYESKFDKTLSVFGENNHTNFLNENNENMTDETRLIYYKKNDSLEINIERMSESTEPQPNNKNVTDELANEKSLPVDEDSFEMITSDEYYDNNSEKNRSSYFGNDILEDFITADTTTLETERSTVQAENEKSTMETIIESSLLKHKRVDMVTEDVSMNTQKSINPDYYSKSSNFTNDYGNESLFKNESDFNNNEVMTENLRSLSNSVSNNQYLTQEGHHIDTTVQYDKETERYLYLQPNNSSLTAEIKGESTSESDIIIYSDKQETTQVSEEAMLKNLELNMIRNKLTLPMMTTTEIPNVFDKNNNQTATILTVLPKEKIKTTNGTSHQILDSFFNVSKNSQYQKNSKRSDEKRIEDTIKSLKGISDILITERNDTASVRGRSIGNVNINMLDNTHVNRYNTRLESMRIGGINNYVNKTGKDTIQLKTVNEDTQSTVVHVPKESEFKNDVDKVNVSVHRRSDIEISDDDY